MSLSFNTQGCPLAPNYQAQGLKFQPSSQFKGKRIRSFNHTEEYVPESVLLLKKKLTVVSR